MGADRSAVQHDTHRLRPALQADARLVWDWANDEETRRLAFHSEPIAWEPHAAWYSAKLASPDALIAILESPEGVPVGQIRFNRTPEGLEVDLSVAAAARSRGLGSELLRQGLRQARGRWRAGTVIAKVLTENDRSKRLFERAGFLSTGSGTLNGKSYYRLERPL